MKKNPAKPAAPAASKLPIITAESLQEHLDRNADQVYSFKKLARELRITTKDEKIDLAVLLQELAKAGTITMLADGTFQNVKGEKYIEGTVEFVNPRFAFVTNPELEEDIKLSVDNLNMALDGDTVRVRLLPQQRNARREGVVVQILKRKRDTFVGKLQMGKRMAFITPDNKRSHFDIAIALEDLNGAQNGDKVTVKILEYGTRERNPTGQVVEVLGRAGENDTEMHAIMAEFDLPWYFPEKLLAEAEQIPAAITPADVASRRDFRGTTTFTIDPFDAKDFDDALSMKNLGNGQWEIGIHIADVTHYVQPGSAIDAEASQRATSVYLVDRTVSMLPERLSNDLCSLRPHEDKLTFSAVFVLNERAEIVQEWIGRSIIHSQRRFTYEEAQELLEGGEGPLAHELRTLNAMAHLLRHRRFAQGSIGFETPEVKFVLDEKGTPLAVVPKVRKDAHKLIEEFMLLANQQVASFIATRTNPHYQLPFVFRVHEPPHADRLKVFSAFARKFGYKVELAENRIATSLNTLIEALQGQPEENVLQHLALRTMSKAKYAVENKGHFGLAFQYYSHFTSPIRRYPDMMVHRLLQHYMDGGKPADVETLEQDCKHSSDMEKRAADAERASIKYKQVEYMRLQADKVFEGIVSGVTEWGFYVEMTETKCEGLVRISDLQDDYYELDAANYRLVGQRTKRIIAFGDKVEVKVKDTNLEKRTIDLMLVDEDLELYTRLRKSPRRNLRRR